jgi:hypothetical protein
LRHGTIGRTASSEEDTPAIMELPYSIRTADERELAWAGVVRAARQLLVHRLERRGANLHDDLFVTGDWFRELLAAGRLPKFAYNGGIHRSDCVSGMKVLVFS